MNNEQIELLDLIYFYMLTNLGVKFTLDDLIMHLTKEPDKSVFFEAILKYRFFIKTHKDTGTVVLPLYMRKIERKAFGILYTIISNLLFLTWIRVSKINNWKDTIESAVPRRNIIITLLFREKYTIEYASHIF